MTWCLPTHHFNVAYFFFSLLNTLILILIAANSSCRSFHELALAGHLLLHPPCATHGPDVLHARDATLPAVKGKEA